jgi:hypothetical protein
MAKDKAEFESEMRPDGLLHKGGKILDPTTLKEVDQNYSLSQTKHKHHQASKAKDFEKAVAEELKFQAKTRAASEGKTEKKVLVQKHKKHHKKHGKKSHSHEKPKSLAQTETKAKKDTQEKKSGIMEHFIDTNSKVHDEKFGGNSKARTTKELKEEIESSKSKPKETKVEDVKPGRKTAGAKLSQRDVRKDLPVDGSKSIFDSVKAEVTDAEKEKKETKKLGSWAEEGMKKAEAKLAIGKESPELK